jgi:hypothetical protein
MYEFDAGKWVEELNPNKYQNKKPCLGLTETG